MADDQWLYENRPKIPSQKSTVTVRFRDLNPDFGLDINPLILEEKKAIEAEMRNLLSTTRGSESFEPNYGSNLPMMLYEPISELTGFLLEADVISSITIWMKGTVIVGANTTVTPLEEEDGYGLYIPYFMVSLGVSATYSFDVLR